MGQKRCQQKGVAIPEQPDEDQEEDGGGVDPQREETIGNEFVSVLGGLDTSAKKEFTPDV